MPLKSTPELGEVFRRWCWRVPGLAPDGRHALLAGYPQHREVIEALTRE
jgi:hypothetical protein